MINKIIIYQSELEHVFEERDLGVTTDMELNVEEHISSKVKKANSIMGLIRRSFSFLDCHLFKKLYITFVRHLEYAQAVWAPHLMKHTNIIENVQKRATKLVKGISEIPYKERLKKFELPTLVYRRARGDMNYISTFISTTKIHYQGLLSHANAQVGSIVSSSIY